MLRHDWPSQLLERGDLVYEHGDLGIVVQCGPTSYDVLWTGGSTTRYRHGVRLDLRPATDQQVADYGEVGIAALHRELAAAVEERRTGAGVWRGQVTPSR